MEKLVVLVMLIAIMVSINAETDLSDASALNALYAGLNSPPQLTKWIASGGDPCGESWIGITCSGTRVTEIKVPSFELFGNMGFGLDKLTAVTAFDISDNKLTNQIPYQLPPNVQVLNLAANGFNTGLPSSISQLTSLKYLNVSHNQITGSVNIPFNSLTALTTLDFSNNIMTGNLPQSFESLKSMTDMFLQNNQFTGTIDVLANLPLENLNVENNQFTGMIPDQLKSKNIKSKDNLFIPSPPLPPGTPAKKTETNRKKSEVESLSTIRSDASEDSGSKSGVNVGVAGLLFSFLLVGALAALILFKSRPGKSSADIEKPFMSLVPQEAQEMKPSATSSTISATPYPGAKNPDPPSNNLVVFDEDDDSEKPIVVPVIPPKRSDTPSRDTEVFTIADMQRATSSFSPKNIIGEGSIGCVYKAQLDNAKFAAVKNINAPLSEHDFLDVISDISKLYHPNITELVGYCNQHGQHLLVYEFYETCTLHEYLHLPDARRTPLTWNDRVQIALGAARALEYMHEVCSPPVIHKNLKSANIFVDADLIPRLSDGGLASFRQVPDQDSGYCAPEVPVSGQYTIKSDVYSFGVVMLELLSGRKPYDSLRPRSEQFLVKWATPQLHDIDTLSKMADPCLEGQYPAMSLSHFADIIALCLQAEPEFRPPMSEVIESLVRLLEQTNRRSN